MLCASSSINGIVDSHRVHCASVFRVKKMMKAGKSIECANPTKRKHVSRTEDPTKAIIKSLKEDATKPMCSLVKEHFSAPVTVLKIMKDVGGKSKAM